MTILQNLIDDANAVLALVESEGRDTGIGGPFSDLRDSIAAATAHSAPAIPMIHNPGTENEVTLRVVLSSEAAGNEYFDSNETLDEALESVKRMVLASVAHGDDFIDRLIGIAVVPKAEYGGDTGYGYGLSKEFVVTNKDGFAFFENHDDEDAVNDFVDEKYLTVAEDGFILDDDDQRMTYEAYQAYDVDII